MGDSVEFNLKIINSIKDNNPDEFKSLLEYYIEHQGENRLILHEGMAMTIAHRIGWSEALLYFYSHRYKTTHYKDQDELKNWMKSNGSTFNRIDQLWKKHLGNLKIPVFLRPAYKWIEQDVKEVRCANLMANGARLIVHHANADLMQSFLEKYSALWYLFLLQMTYLGKLEFEALVEQLAAQHDELKYTCSLYIAFGHLDFAVRLYGKASKVELVTDWEEYIKLALVSESWTCLAWVLAQGAYAGSDFDDAIHQIYQWCSVASEAFLKKVAKYYGFAVKTCPSDWKSSHLHFTHLMVIYGAKTFKYKISCLLRKKRKIVRLILCMMVLKVTSSKSQFNNSLREALEVVLFYGDVEACKAILSVFNPKNSFCFIHWAIYSQKIELLDLILKRWPGVDINALDEHGHSPLCLSILTGNLQVVEWVLRQRPNLYQKTPWKDLTPLKLAESLGYTEIAKALAFNDSG